MRVLIIENNDIKLRMLERWVSDAFPKCVADSAKSYQSGLIAIMNGSHDWVLLDMTLPVFEEKGGMLVRDQLTFGGRLILEEMVINNIVKKVIVVTQYRTFPKAGKQVTFEELRKDLLDEFPGILQECVFLRSLDQKWMATMEDCMKALDL